MTVDDFGNWDPGPLEPGEKLFVGAGEAHEIACVDYDLTEARYIASFREAGEVLTTHVLNGGVQDLLVFPILFSYRHWLELQLKWLITVGSRWRGEEPRAVHTHELRALWREARAAIEAAFPNDPADLDHIEAIIGELADVDPGSVSFRYARDRKGKTNVPEELVRVNIGHVAGVMLKVGLIFDGAATAMEEMIDATPDFGP